MIAIRLTSILPPAIGALLAVMLVPAIDSGVDGVRAIYDRHDPVATVEVQRLPSPEPGEMRVVMRVTKHRECELLQVQAFEAQPHGWQRINAGKLDAGSAMSVPPGMSVRGAVWRLWPTTIGRLRLSLAYDCGGRVVRLPVEVT